MGSQDEEPDARSVVNRILAAATALVLTAELLALTAILRIVIDLYTAKTR